jgi:tetratricopeptide (TPR) repeat protein
LTEAVGALAKLQTAFPQVPGIGIALANVYGQLGWKVEYNNTIKALEHQFPENLETLHSAAEVYKTEGDYKAADRILAVVRKLDPGSEASLNQALEREDYDAALAQLKALAARKAEHKKENGQRITDLMIRTGRSSESAEHLKSLIADNPTDSSLHLALADWLFAQGDRAALHKTLASAVESGADQGPLVDAIDLVTGMTELQPYRLNAKKLIAEYEQSGKQLPGNAARVLDYSVVWVRADGSSRTLEHELVRIQSAEAISRFAEQKLEGLILNMRVIKKDGRTLEPEPVAGKPSFTFPHLEEGDYIDTEQILFSRRDGTGKQYNGPRWFFREENVAYARSELVVISPSSQTLQIETHGEVPPPQITRDGEFVTRRWRMDHTPAAPQEPFSAPVTEFLPSVSVGWGISLQHNIEDLNTRVAETIPVDPRVSRIARHIVDQVAPDAQRARALAVYRWVQANIADGDESDGRRVVMGKSGNRWQALVTLCRSLGIKAQFVLAKSRLAPKAPGPISESQQFGAAVLKVSTNAGPVWLTLDDKYAPFGYLPAEVRGMPGFQLGDEKPIAVVLPDDGSLDSIEFAGDLDLAADGTAELTLVQTFRGKPGVQLRKGLAELPENRLHDVLEAQLLGRSLHGARLKNFRILRAADAEAPLSIEMHATVPAFAQLQHGMLVISPPYVLQLSQLSTLSSRQTPLLIMETTRQRVTLRIRLPKGAKVAKPNDIELEQDGRKVVVADHLQDDRLILEREVVVPAGRIQPDAYANLVEFARAADDAQSQDILVTLPAN